MYRLGVLGGFAGVFSATDCSCAFGSECWVLVDGAVGSMATIPAVIDGRTVAGTLGFPVWVPAALCLRVLRKHFRGML